MKIRTDFVTNSSSSSFCVEIDVCSKDGKHARLDIIPEDQYVGGGGVANWKGSVTEILKIENVKDLIQIIKKSIVFEDADICFEDIEGADKELKDYSIESMLHFFKERIEAGRPIKRDYDDDYDGHFPYFLQVQRDIDSFEKELENKIGDVSNIAGMKFRRTWYAWGEFASCYFINLDCYNSELPDLAKSVLTSEGEEKEKAKDVFQKHLSDYPGVFCEDFRKFPTGFMNAKKNKCSIVWTKIARNIEEFAKKIASLPEDDKDFPTHDFGVETTVIDMQSKKITQIAEYILGGYPENNRDNEYETGLTEAAERCDNETISFGAYPQGEKGGKAPAEWIVLAKENEKALVISKYALDCRKYNSTKTDVTWENCSLRKWMNDTFLNNAFSADEQAKIASTNVSADKNPNYSTNPGNATTDKVFLLSIAEAKKYFTTDESRKCAPTAYVKAQGAWTSDSSKTASGEATCLWWLRSPGDCQSRAAGVYGDGSVSDRGHSVNDDDYCVRPAMWINLDS